MEKKKISLLGSTGSIGTQTLEVVSENSDILSVAALAAGTNVNLLEEQVRKFKPALAVMWSEEAASELKNESRTRTLKFSPAWTDLLKPQLLRKRTLCSPQ